MINVGGAEIHLQIANHVEQDESHHCDSADCHDVFLAHGRGVQVKEE